jgi:RNA polymerase sigma factor (sigma-70 family)
MASGHYGAVVGQVRRLFGTGTVAGMSESQLLRRYVTRRDEAAFEALVARHGPMVLGVCRRVLGEGADVDDAFQATFLVLVKKAAALGERDAVGHWLYGVACRVALRARSDAARRRSRERAGAAAEAVPATDHDDVSRRELAAAIDEELARLPAKYRAPVVLCHVEGLSHDEAARQLGWPVGSVKGRLSRARELLKGRLARRGLAPAAGAIAALAHDARAAVPPALAASTVRAALAIAAGGPTAGVVSATAAALMEGVITTMSLTRIKVGVAALVALGAGAGVLSYQASGGPEGKPAVEKTSAQPTANKGVRNPSSPAMDMMPMMMSMMGDSDAKNKAVLDKLEERINMAFPNETPVEDVLKYIKSASAGPNDTGIPIYVDPAGMQEAGKTMTSRVSLNVEGVPLKDSLHWLLRPLGLDYWVADGFLTISSRAAMIDREIGELKEDLRRVTAQLQVVERRAARPAGAPTTTTKPRAGGDEQGIRDLRFDKDPRSRAVQEVLNEPVAMSFANETPLEDVLKYIKAATAGKPSIPIYVDPVGLQEAEKTMTSPIQIDLEGVPLKTTLTLLLKQLGLVFNVKEGVLIITSESSEDILTPLTELQEKAERGELTPEEHARLIEMMKTRHEVEKLNKEFLELSKDSRGRQ